MEYSYTAKKIDGTLVNGTATADDREGVVRRLQAANMFPVNITEQKPAWSFRRADRVSRGVLALFVRRLADLLHGGLTLARALEVLQRQTEQPVLKRVAVDLLEQVRDGVHLSDALAKHTNIFPVYFAGAVKAGETGGMLDAVMGRLSEFLEKEHDIRTRVQSAMAYPLIMVATGMASVIFLMLFVMPKFQMMFADMGHALPLPTKMLLMVSSMLQSYWWLFLAIIAAAAWGIRGYATNPAKRLRLELLTFRIPLFGELMRKELIARFVRMLGALLHNGVPLLDALELTRATIPNTVIQTEIDALVRSVREGGGIVEPLRKSTVFPMILADMAAVGEETGNLDASLLRVCDAYEHEVEYTVKTLTSVLEPAVILLVGVVVGTIAIAMMLPIFEASTLMR